MSTDILLYLSVSEWLALDRRGSTVLARGRLATSDDQADWAALRDLATETRGRLSAEVIVGGECCHFLSLPWSDALMEPAESDSYARAAFVGVYGAIASTWSITVADGAYGCLRLACATPPFGLAEVDALEEEGVIRLLSAVPSASFIYGLLRRQLTGPQGVLGFADGAGFSVLRWNESGVVEANFLPATAGYGAVHDWLTRAELVFGPVPARYWVAADGAGGPDGWQVVGNQMNCASLLALTAFGSL